MICPKCGSLSVQSSESNLFWRCEECNWDSDKDAEFVVNFYQAKEPCKECPFVVNCTPGWLGPDSVDDVIRRVHTEESYTCHTSIDGKPSKGGVVDVFKHGGRHCTGALMHASISFKRFRNPHLSKLQNAISKIFEEKFKGKILGLREFREYHGKPQRKKAKKKS